MAEVLHTHSQMSMEVRGDHSPAPAPLPPFVFPGKPRANDDVPSRERYIANSKAPGPQGHNQRSRPQRISINSLPAFDFSPAAAIPGKASPSPPRSPLRRTPSTHSSGHRRNGSEFVGGDIARGGPMLVSSSPTKSEHSTGHRRDGSGFFGANPIPAIENAHKQATNENASKVQPEIHLGPPTTRRGHAHKRSGAISSHDLSNILKPSIEPRSGSAPTTPSDPMFQPTIPPVLNTSNSQPMSPRYASEPSTPPIENDLHGSDGETKSRVRISDVLEFIPRPLSTISSETSSSLSTIRANHSLTNSISSIVSAGTSSPPSTNPTAARRQSYSRQSQARSGVGYLIESPCHSSVGWDSDVLGRESPLRRPSSAPTEESALQQNNTSSNTSTLAKTSNDNVLLPGSSESGLTIDSDATFPDIANLNFKRRMTPSNNSPLIRPRTSPEPKVMKRQRKGRSWAGLLSRKAKSEEQTTIPTRRAPTPPAFTPFSDAEISLDQINFDDDADCVIESAPSLVRPVRLREDRPLRTPSGPLSASEIEIPAGVLDIDLALSSFDVSSTGPAFDEVIASNVAGSKRRLHSSGTTGGFAGPGMHYHRRAESAPELDAVDRSGFGFPRLGSNPAMAIEEEEEDEEDCEEAHQRVTEEKLSRQDGVTEIEASGLGVKVVEVASGNDKPIRRRRRRATDEDVETPKAYSPVLEECSPVEVVGADEEPRFSVVTKSSDESTITPTPSDEPIGTHSTSSPFDFALPTPALTYGTSESTSAVSSPDFTKTSFEGSRLHTASSSITDGVTLSSSRAGDHTLCSHSSVDDVPSLTSSASTMSARPPRVSSSANSGFSAERSSSLSAAIPTRRRPVSSHKRLSLASLTRLAGSSYNRSKLNIEVIAPTDNEEPIEKRKKGNRISRMMKFWKSKEKPSS
ncbi:hypothetical protein MMC21_000139 [Puttea exsequens]|nr:hypothetical protein [Puttea exsequens]